jgi:UrcA family protein
VKTAIRRAAIALALISVATVSAASSLDPPPQRIVKFGDLNLTTDSGVALLYARIRNAAREVCEAGTVWNIDALLESKDCTERAIERAVEEINDPQLKSYHRARSQVSALAQP